MGGRNDAWFVGQRRRRRRVERNLSKGIVGTETGVVTVIAQVVKGFVRVLDSDFRNSCVGEEGTRDGIEEMTTVGLVLMGR